MRLLLVEDKETFRRLLVQSLEGSSWDVLAVGDPQEALEALDRSSFEVLVTDLRLPGFSGLELLRRAKRLRPGLRVVLMSAFGEPKDIVEAMRSGADEFLPKPFDLDHFHAILDRLRELAVAPPPDPREPWIACSPSMRALDLALTKTAEGSAAVLILGENGAGRLRTARRLHTLRDPQAPFLVAGASSLPGPGPVSHGSICLTDLDGLTSAQARSLGEIVDQATGLCWMACARALDEVPETLRLRLGVVTFRIPPLRERREDILPLFRSFLERICRREGRPVPLVERAVERELLQRPWEGNLPELAWCADQALRMSPGAILGGLPLHSHAQEQTLCLRLPEPAPLEIMLAEIGRLAEPSLLRRALASHPGNPSAAAAALGLTLRTFAHRLREYRISLDEQ